MATSKTAAVSIDLLGEDGDCRACEQTLRAIQMQKRLLDATQKMNGAGDDAASPDRQDGMSYGDHRALLVNAEARLLADQPDYVIEYLRSQAPSRRAL